MGRPNLSLTKIVTDAFLAKLVGPRGERFWSSVARAALSVLGDVEPAAPAPPATNGANGHRPHRLPPKRPNGARAKGSASASGGRCTACGQVGHRKNHLVCPKRGTRQVRTQSPGKAPRSTNEDEPAAAGPAAASDGRPSARKYSPHARGRNLRPPTAAQRRLLAIESYDVSLQQLRPRTRADCATGPRPCPWVGCRYHFAFEIHPETGALREVFPDFNIAVDPGAGLLRMQAEIGSTCALDVLERDEVENVGGVLTLYQAALSTAPLGQTPGGLTIAQTGGWFNIGTERARQIASLAMQELRVKLRRIFGNEFTRTRKRPRHSAGAKEPSGEQPDHSIGFGHLLSQRLREKFGRQEAARTRWNGGGPPKAGPAVEGSGPPCPAPSGETTVVAADSVGASSPAPAPPIEGDLIAFPQRPATGAAGAGAAATDDEPTALELATS
jgi:hypothetical protein